MGPNCPMFPRLQREFNYFPTYSQDGWHHDLTLTACCLIISAIAWHIARMGP